MTAAGEAVHVVDDWSQLVAALVDLPNFPAFAAGLAADLAVLVGGVTRLLLDYGGDIAVSAAARREATRHLLACLARLAERSREGLFPQFMLAGLEPKALSMLFAGEIHCLLLDPQQNAEVRSDSGSSAGFYKG